jgi:hypothetical protein
MNGPIETAATLRSIQEHLAKAQELMDGLRPNSTFGARLQHLLDEIEEEIGGELPKCAGDLG